MSKAGQPMIERVALYLFMRECRAAVDPLREFYVWYSDALYFLTALTRGENK